MRKSLLSLATLVLFTIGSCGCERKSEGSFKEDILRRDLKKLRYEIDNYTSDKEKAPETLQDLVDSGYLRKIPKDPFTNSEETWQVEMSDRDQNPRGISDVHSASNLVGSDGTPYSSW